MSHSTKIISVVVIVYVISATAERILSNVSHHYPDHEVFFNFQFFDKENITYGVCDNENSQCLSQKTCEIFLERVDGNETRVSSCNVTIKSENEDSVINKFIRVNQFGSSKSIVTFWEDDSNKDFIDLVKFSIVNFADCVISEANVTLASPKNNSDDYSIPFTLIPYENDKFDVVLTNGEYDGDNEKLRKITFDDKGNKVNEINDWIAIGSNTTIAYGIPLEMDDCSVNHVVIDQDPDTIKLHLVGNNASSLLKTYDCEPYQSTYSTAYKTIGICCYLDKLINCTQFDTDGNLQLKTSIAMDYKSYAIQMSNTRNGGFVLLTAKHIKCETQFCESNTFNYYLTRLDTSGKEVGFMMVGQLCCPCQRMAPHYKLFNLSKKEYCVSMACVYINYERVDDGSGYLNLTTKCFTDDDLMDNQLT